ncbi:MAG TPA: hypothetical protein VKB51_14895 [bacterium]|nr:hypothetical protein [bacterium]
MHGKPRPKPPSLPWRPAGLLTLLLALLLLPLAPHAAGARELRRQMPYLRAMLMGNAYSAVADEASVLMYNPAGLAGLKTGTIEVTPLHFAADRNLTGLLLDPTAVKNQYSGLSPTELANKVGTSLFYNVSLRTPFLYNPKQGTAFGIGAETLGAVSVVQDSLGFPALQLEAFVDETVLWSSYGQFGPLSLGLTAKLINRAGIDKTIDFATLYASGGSLNLANDPDFQALEQGQTRVRGGLDLGMVYRFPGAENWQPRLALAVLNLGGHDSQSGYHGIQFGTPPDANTRPLYGEFPLNVVAGFAVSPTYNDIRYTFDVDLVDLGYKALDGRSLNNRTRVGMEIGVGPHEDGTALFSLLFGWNATHFSVGVLTRVSIFEIGFGRYTVEKGSRPGENPEDRRAVVIALRI